MRVKIFVVTHKIFDLPRNKGGCYLPIVAGAANKNETFPCQYILDSSSINISEKHDKYSEYTVVYWVRHNVDDADIIGINHYRRYFVKMNWFQYTLSFLLGLQNFQQKKILTEKQIRKIFDDGYDCILPRKESKYPENMTELFSKYHNQQIIDDTREVIAADYPEYLQYFDSVFKSNNYYLKCICIMKKDLFFRYSDWMLDIMSKLENKKWCSGKRELAFLGECLLNVFISQNIAENKCRIKEMYFVNTDRSIKDFGKIDMELWAPGWLKKLVSDLRYWGKNR